MAEIAKQGNTMSVFHFVKSAIPSVLLNLAIIWYFRLGHLITDGKQGLPQDLAVHMTVAVGIIVLLAVIMDIFAFLFRKYCFQAKD